MSRNGFRILEVIYSVLSFQSLNEDVSRQREREKQLQVRFATLQDELASLKCGPVNGGVGGNSAIREQSRDAVITVGE